MATSTQGQVVGLIVQKVQGLNLSQVIGRPCPVFDGPNGTDNEDNFVVVHYTPGSHRQEWAGLGALAMDEWYEVTVAVWCYDGGVAPPGTYGSQNPQETVRNNCAAIAAAIEAALKADVNLSIQNGGPLASTFWTTVASQPLNQEVPESANGMGVFASIDMRVRCRAQIRT